MVKTYQSIAIMALPATAVRRRLAAVESLLPPGAVPTGSRGLVLAEALRLFAEHGYGPASIRDIADRVGIKSASLYSLFPSKAHVLAELMRIGNEEHHGRIRRALLEVGSDPKEQLKAVVRAHVLTHAEYPMLAVVLTTELHALPAEFPLPSGELRRQSEKLLIEIIERGVKLGVFQVDDPALALNAIGGMGLRVAHWYGPNTEKSPQQVADTFAEYACRIVGVLNKG